jgi:hypothetical protein
MHKVWLILLLSSIVIERTGLADAKKVKIEIVSADLSSDSNAKYDLFAVVVRLGSKVIWKTPFVKGGKPTWNKTVALSSRFKNAIVLEIVRISSAGECKERGKKTDKLLSEALDEMVGDYEDPEGSSCLDANKVEEEKTYCKASTRWTEEAQVLVLPCGTGEIKLRVK